MNALETPARPAAKPTSSTLYFGPWYRRSPFFEKTLDAVPTGRVGLWSKADSQVLFDDLLVEHL